jgi:hypothetical protein
MSKVSFGRANGVWSSWKNTSELIQVIFVEISHQVDELVIRDIKTDIHILVSVFHWTHVFVLSLEKSTYEQLFHVIIITRHRFHVNSFTFTSSTFAVNLMCSDSNFGSRVFLRFICSSLFSLKI